MIVRNTVTGDDLLLADYVIQRWCERGNGDTASLVQHLTTAVRWGGQRGTNFLLASGEHVFPVAVIGGAKVVKTVLTKAMAIVNMQIVGLEHSLPVPVAQRSPVPNVKQADPFEYDPDKIARLAAAHAFGGVPKKDRYAQMRADGINPNGAVGDIYRVAYASANYLMMALSEAQQSESNSSKANDPCLESPTT